MSRSKAIGTRWETRVRLYMTDALDDHRIERRALHGSSDMGDLAHIFAHGNEGIAECKAVKSWGPKMLSEWREQTVTERDNSDADFGLLIVKVPNRPTGMAQVHVTVRDLTRICLGIDSHGELADLYDDMWVQMTLDECIAMIGGV